MGQLKFGLISFIVSQCLSASIHGRANEGRKKENESPDKRSLSQTSKVLFINKSPFTKAVLNFLCLFSDRCS